MHKKAASTSGFFDLWGRALLLVKLDPVLHFLFQVFASFVLEHHIDLLASLFFDNSNEGIEML